MGTRNRPGLYDCMAHADPDEPVFVLRGQDLLAAPLVRVWADLAALGTAGNPEERAQHLKDYFNALVDEVLQAGPDCPIEKCQEAAALAAQMEQWPGRKFPD